MPPAKHRRSYNTVDDLKNCLVRKHCVAFANYIVDMLTNPVYPGPTLLYMQRQSGSYNSQNENRVIHDIQECARSFPSLHPILDYFTSADGKSQRLLALRGTIPITYKGSAYKIPVHMWVMPYHPAGPPLVFVVPTRAMVFRHRHPHVDSSNGLVYMPYLASWDALTSTISGTVNAMIQVFSIKPPVYSRETPASTLQDDVDRQRLIAELSERLETEMTRKTATAKRTVNRMLANQTALKRDENARQAKRRQIAREKKELENLEQQLRRRLFELRRWRVLHPDPPHGAAVDDITRPRTALCQQMVDCSALDAAQTDALDQIDEALATGVIENEEYLRDVRKVARQQFFTRALQRRVKQQTATTEKPEETMGVVPPQQPTSRASSHQRNTPAKSIHETYRSRSDT